MKGLELSRRFYEECGKPMFERDFSDLMPYLCFGLVGAGSECFGFDDTVSADHDFEPGFCVFYPEDKLTRRQIFLLERAYASLPKEFIGYHRSPCNPVGGNRHGPIAIGDFYRDRIGSPDGLHSLEEWMAVPPEYLSEATNGTVFCDNFGRFSEIRHSVSEMPEDVRLKKLAGHLLLCAQAGQYNLSRCLSHGEKGAAGLARDEFVRHALSASFLVLKQHQPYYKWSFRALSLIQEGKPIAEKLTDLLTEALDTHSPEKAEFICGMLSELLLMKHLIQIKRDFLEGSAYEINNLISDASLRNESVLAGV